MIYAVCYIILIVLANVATAYIPPLHIFMFIVPAGTVLIGLTFLCRSVLQIKKGRFTAYLMIVIATLVSLIFSLSMSNLLYITIASILSFVVSEVTDTEVFTRMKSDLLKRFLYSGIIGGFLDSIIFVVIGLSPLTTNILPWDAVIITILGQFIIKSIMQLPAFYYSKEGTKE